MDLPSYFVDFLADIRLTPHQVSDLKSGHETLRTRLTEDGDLAPLVLSTFLQGSYRRATAVRPVGEGSKADVDIIVVTNIDSGATTPDAALELFVPFLKKHYKGKWTRQGRSLNVELDSVLLDVVVTSAPDAADREALNKDAVRSGDTLEEVSDWRLTPSWVARARREGGGNFTKLMESARTEPEYHLHPLLIPDRDAKKWKATHPIEQIRWTRDKNSRCNTHYVNVVKAIKWWRVQDTPDEYPKGYPLEHLVGSCCPDGISSVATGVTLTLEALRDTYSHHIAAKTVPNLQDHGVSHDVLARLTAAEFAAFMSRVQNAATVARAALDATDIDDAAEGWRQLFGSRFPEGPNRGRGQKSSGTPPGGFSPRAAPTTLTGGRFA